MKTWHPQLILLTGLLMLLSSQSARSQNVTENTCDQNFRPKVDGYEAEDVIVEGCTDTSPVDDAGVRKNFGANAPNGSNLPAE